MPSEGRTVDGLKARILLMFGGVAGAHRLYLEQIPEAFIFFSTAGIALLGWQEKRLTILLPGVFHDSFYLTDMVRHYNIVSDDAKENGLRIKRARVQEATSRFVAFSFRRFVASILYSLWLGALAAVAAALSFAARAPTGLAMVSATAAALTAGVYIVGNSGGQRRDLLNMWFGCFSVLFVLVHILDSGLPRAMLFAAMAGTLMGNRTARVRAPTNRPPYNPRHFVFWSSLFALLICVLAVGASRHIFERRISVTTAKGITSSKTSSVGALVYDRFFEQKRVDDFFADNASPKWWNIGKRKAEEKPKAAPATPWESFWNHFDLPDWTAKAPSWAEYCAVFIVDLLRAEVRSREFAKKKEAATIPPEPLKWAGWRIYAIMATASDDELAKLCKRFYTEMKADEKKNNGEKTTDFKVVSVQTACDTLEAL